MSKIYLASPFFTVEQEELVATAEHILYKMGQEVFSPREQKYPGLEPGTVEWRTAVYNNNMKHIQWADYVVAIVAEGNYSDSGTAVEIGYAYGIHKPVIILNPTDNIINLMTSDSLHAYIPNWAALEDYDFDKLPGIPYKGEVI